MSIQIFIQENLTQMNKAYSNKQITLSMCKWGKGEGLGEGVCLCVVVGGGGWAGALSRLSIDQQGFLIKNWSHELSKQHGVYLDNVLPDQEKCWFSMRMGALPVAMHQCGYIINKERGV